MVAQITVKCMHFNLWYLNYKEWECVGKTVYFQVSCAEWISCRSQDCAFISELVIFPGASEWCILLNTMNYLAPSGLAHLFAGSHCLQSFLPSTVSKTEGLLDDTIISLNCQYACTEMPNCAGEARTHVGICFCPLHCGDSNLWQQTLWRREERGKKRKEIQ